MRKLFVLLGAAVALIASASVNRDVSVPYNMYVDPGTHSCLVRWDDDDNSAWNLRYRLFTDEPDEPVLLHSLTGSAYTGSYADITLPAPWGGVNVRAGRSAIYIKNNYNGVARGYITYTIPEGYNDATFKVMVTTQNSTSDGKGDVTVYTPQTAAVSHNFSANETFYWEVQASSGEQITMYSNDASYSPNMTLIAVYYVPTNEWTYVNDLVKKWYNIEGLEMETDYEVQVQGIGDDGSLSDWCRPDVFTTLDEEPIIPTVHIMGEIDNQAWAPDAGTKMEYNPGTETYTATVHAEADASFGFTTMIDDDDQGGWNYILPYRFGPESDGEFYLTEERIGQSLTLSFDHFSDVYVLTTGDYDITVSLEQKYIIIGKAAPSILLGDVNEDNMVDINDITDMISYVLGNPVSPFNTLNANVIADDTIDINDVTELINFVLTGVWSN